MAYGAAEGTGASDSEYLGRVLPAGRFSRTLRYGERLSARFYADKG